MSSPTTPSLIAIALLVMCSVFSQANAACTDAPAAGVDWSGCDKQGQNFSGIDLSNANFSGANLTDASFHDVDLTGADFSGANLSHAAITTGLIADFSTGDLPYRLSAVNFSMADLRGAILYPVFENVDFRGAELAGARFSLDGTGNDPDYLCVANGSARFYDNQIAKYLFPDINNSYYRIAVSGMGISTLYPDNTLCAGSTFSNIVLERSPDATDIAPIAVWSQAAAGDFDTLANLNLASASSSLTGSAEVVVDGSPGDQVFATAAETSPWWEIDLGNHYRAEELVLVAMNENGNDIRDAVIMVSDYPFDTDPLTPQNFDTVSRYNELQNPLKTNQITVGRTLRYIRIQRPSAGSQSLGFEQLRVMGHLTDESGNPWIPDYAAPANFDPYADLPPNNCGGGFFDETRIESTKRCVVEQDADLSNCDFSGRIFAAEDFTVVASLENADFSGADLTGANFGPYTTGGSIANLTLQSVNFHGANLAGASLSGANLSYADFRGAYLGDAYFGTALAHCAIFSGEIPANLNLDYHSASQANQPVTAPLILSSGHVGYARQSSTDLDSPPNLAIDDSTSSHSITALEHSPWWDLDMGAVYVLERIETLADEATGSFEGAQLLISDWPLPANPLERIDGTTIRSYPLTQSINGYLTPVGATGRYLRVQLPDNGTARRLGIFDLKAGTTGIPTSPSTFQPLTEAQQDMLPQTLTLRQNIDRTRTQLAGNETDSLNGDLSSLSSTTGRIIDKTALVTQVREQLASLDENMQSTLDLIRTMELYRPVRQNPTFRRFRDRIISVKRRVAQAATLTADFDDRLQYLRDGGQLLRNGIGDLRDEALQYNAYLHTGHNYLEEHVRCAVNGEGAPGLSALEGFSLGGNAQMEFLLSELGTDAPLRTAIRGSDQALLALLDTLTIAELEAFEAALTQLQDAFDAVFTPLKQVADVLATEIDIGLGPISIQDVLDVLNDAISAIPYADELMDEVSRLLDPVIAPVMAELENLLGINLDILPDLPGFDPLQQAITRVTQEIESYRTVFLDALNELQLPDLSIDFEPLLEAPFPFCQGITLPPQWPKLEEDLDGDGLSNGVELKLMAIDPYPTKLATLAHSPDTDKDGLDDYFEVLYEGFSPTFNDRDNEVHADYDGDGLLNFEESLHGSNPWLVDSDGDSLPDAAEVAAGLDPSLRDSDGNGIEDALEDSDGDGVINGEEILLGLRISDPDDIFEDMDADGLNNLTEIRAGSRLDNPAPVAVDDRIEVVAGKAASFNILMNDHSTDGDPVAFNSATAVLPLKGQWSIDNTGQVEFNSGNAFNGLATAETLQFFYRIHDQGGSDLALVTVIVNPQTGSGNTTPDDEDAPIESGPETQTDEDGDTDTTTESDATDNTQSDGNTGNNSEGETDTPTADESQPTGQASDGTKKSHGGAGGLDFWLLLLLVSAAIISARRRQIVEVAAIIPMNRC